MDGILQVGATRGDGSVGENITENVKRISDIPLKLDQPLNITVRGECYLPRAEFERINIQRQEMVRPNLPIHVMLQQELFVN